MYVVPIDPRHLVDVRHRELELVGDVGRGVKVDGGRLDPRMVRRATDAYRTGYVLAFDRY